MGWYIWCTVRAGEGRRPWAGLYYIPTIFENHTLKAPNIPFKKVVLPEKVKCGGTEGEIVVANGRLPSPASHTRFKCLKIAFLKLHKSTILAFFKYFAFPSLYNLFNISLWFQHFSCFFYLKTVIMLSLEIFSKILLFFSETLFNH